MRKTILRLVLAAAVAAGATACSTDLSEVWDSITSITKRLTAVEETCERLNTNVQSMQTILQAHAASDCVTGVSAVTENGREVGYVLSFRNSGNVTLYHGNDGKDGSNGSDGATPAVSLKKDNDGNYYWTLDGEWLVDSDGNKVKAHGADGTDGKDGKDGVTPQFKIENECWMMSADGGKTWENLGRAVGEKGEPGAAGTNSETLIASIDYTTSDLMVSIKLANGDVIELPTQKAFKALEELCKAANNNITSLKELLSGSRVIKSVTAITGGYRIVLAGITSSDLNEEITILNGTDGDEGATPLIGVKSDDDGKMYWTVNGEWLLDADDSKVKVEGTDGMTPELQIKDGNWEVSTDGGKSWKVLGKATGDEGCSILKSVTQDDTTVRFELTTGEIITVSKSNDASIVLGNNMIAYTTSNAMHVYGNSKVSPVFVNYEKLGDTFYNYYDKEISIFYDSLLRSGIYEITSITLPESVTRIHDYAFSSWKLLETIDLSKNLTSIGTYAFNNCESLKSIEIPESVTEIQDHAFDACKSLTSVRGLAGVKSIGSYAFIGCGQLTSIDLPEGLTAIGDWAFYGGGYGHKLLSITIPGTVTAFGKNAFHNSRVESVEIKEGVTYIGSGAFSYCKSLTSVSIPSTVTSIESSAFGECIKLGSVSIPSDEINIGTKAFYGCTSLASVEILSNKASIGNEAFSGCSSLKEVYVKATTPPELNEGWVFAGSPSNLKIYIPKGTLEAYKSANSWSNYADKLVEYDYENNQV